MEQWTIAGAQTHRRVRLMARLFEFNHQPDHLHDLLARLQTGLSEDVTTIDFMEVIVITQPTCSDRLHICEQNVQRMYRRITGTVSQKHNTCTNNSSVQLCAESKTDHLVCVLECSLLI